MTSRVSCGQAYRLCGLMGLFWVGLGFLGERRRISAVLRGFWLLLAVYRGVIYEAGNMMDVIGLLRSGEEQEGDFERLFNSALGMGIALLFLPTLLLLPARLHRLVQLLRDAPLPQKVARALGRRHRRAGNIMFLLLCLVLCLGVAVDHLRFDSLTTANVFKPARGNRHVSALLALVSYLVVFAHATTLAYAIKLGNAAACVHEHGGAALRPIMIVTLVSGVFAGVMATVGLLLFLFVLKPRLTSLLLFNTLIALVVVVSICADLAWVFALTVMHSNEAQRSASLRTAHLAHQPWKHRIAYDASADGDDGETSIDLAAFDNDGSDKRSPDHIWPILRPSLAVTAGAAVAIILWLLPFVATAGPPHLLDDDRLFLGQADHVPGTPIVYVAVFLFAPLYGVAFVVGAAYTVPLREWPRSILLVPLPATLAMMAVQGFVVLSHPILAFAVTAGLWVISAIGTVVYLRRVRPRWTFVNSLAITCFAAAILETSFALWIVPLFLDSSQDERDRIAIRVSFAFVTSIFAFLQFPAIERFASSPLVLRHYVPYLIAASLSIFGRLMVSGVDTLFGQFISVLIISVFEVLTVVAVPVVRGLVFFLKNRERGVLHSVHHAIDHAASPLRAPAQVIRIITELISILIVPFGVLCHATVWYDDIDYGALALNLFLSAIMQIAVELISDTIILYIRTRRQNVRFARAFDGGQVSMAILLFVFCAVPIAIAASGSIRLLRGVMLASLE